MGLQGRVAIVTGEGGASAGPSPSDWPLTVPAWQ